MTKLLIFAALLVAVVVAEVDDRHERHRRAADNLGTISRRFLDQMKSHEKARRDAHLESIQKLANSVTASLRRRNLDTNNDAVTKEATLATHIGKAISTSKRAVEGLMMRRRGLESNGIATKESNIAKQFGKVISTTKRGIVNTNLMIMRKRSLESNGLATKEANIATQFGKAIATSKRAVVGLMMRRGLENNGAASKEANLATNIGKAITTSKRAMKGVVMRRGLDVNNKEAKLVANIGQAVSESKTAVRGLANRMLTKRTLDNNMAIKSALGKVQQQVRAQRYVGAKYTRVEEDALSKLKNSLSQVKRMVEKLRK